MYTCAHTVYLYTDAVVNKRWRMDEVIGPLQSKLAFLSGRCDVQC